jgi:transcriptional regulator with XRE-family HTH domain
MTTRRFIDLDPGKPVRFREWRAYRGMTQEQVQDLLEWSPGRLSKLESGATAWGGEVLTALARVYACEPTDLFDLPPETPQPFAPAGAGIAGIVEMHRLIIRLQTEIGELKSAFMPRLQALEDRLAEAGAIAENAVKDAEELTGLFDRFASKLPAKKTKPRGRKVPPGKISA